MKCQNCGADIVEGHLYCDICGEEIRIVPDFEPELEHHMIEALSTMVEDIEDKKEADYPEEKEAIKEKTGRLLDYRVIAGVVAAFFLLIILVLIGVGLYRTYSVAYQVQQARQYAQKGNYAEALQYLWRAMELEPENTDYAFLIAGYYYELADTQQTIEVLQGVINGKYAADEAKEKAYRMLITIYDEQGEYQTISELLQACQVEAVVTQFQHYLAKNPEFSYAGGNYDEVIPLKLSANTTGNIYYTLNGMTPNENSPVYTAPIFLETGDYVVSALFINEYGIQSEVVRNQYHISLIAPDAPEILQYSGVYEEPIRIEVVIPAYGKVYYTTDGTDPTQDSMLYTEPIPLPLGRSQFKFVVISEEGIAGEVMLRNYELSLKTDISAEAAVYHVIQALVDQHVLQDITGKAPGVSGNYVYKFDSLIEIPEQGYYYMINEYYQDPVGNEIKSERLYAVGIYDGIPNRLIYDETGEMGLIPLR